MNNCVAINIIDDGKILNKNGIPILFYWDGKSDISKDLTSSNKFKEFLENLVLNKNQYTTARIAYWCFTEDKNNNWNEVYTEKVIDIQDLFKFDTLGGVELPFSYVYDINEKLYKKVFESEYIRRANSFEIASKDIYDSIKNKYGDRVNKTTYTEYVRSELSKLTSKLSNENIEFIIHILTEKF